MLDAPESGSEMFERGEDLIYEAASLEFARRELFIEMLVSAIPERRGLLRGYAYSKAHSWADADDLVQDALLDALQRWQTYDSTRPLTPWLLGCIAMRSKRLRRSRFYRKRTAEQLRAPTSSPHAKRRHANRIEDNTHVRLAFSSAVASIRDLELRNVIIRRCWELEPWEEIARDCLVPTETLKSRARPHIHILRERLKDFRPKRRRRSGYPPVLRRR
jgi:RNA polymerase sigma factor (sigma-70 family)